jgi:murein DD-endopeptidase MepM/ murein hydrolase activator NlpD
MNYFDGTLEELRAFCELEPQVPVDPPLSALYWPCLEKWRITQYFGERPAQYPTSKGHNGVDFGTPVGSDIYAAWDGVVEVAREDKTGYGRHVRIRHSHGLTIYGHLSAMFVSVGDAVKAKQLIGLSGGSVSDPYAGMSTGPHLHFEYRWDVPAPQVPGGYVYNAVDVLPLLISHEEAGMLYKVKVIVGALNVRTGPGIGIGKVGIVYENNELPVYEERDGWLRIGAGRWISGSSLYVVKIGDTPALTDKEKLDILWGWYEKQV